MSIPSRRARVLATAAKPARVLAAAAMAIMGTACVGGPASAVGGSVSAQAAPAVAASAVVAAPEIPGTPAGAQLRWLLDAVARAPIAPDELAGHFAASFLQRVPADQVNQVLAGLRDLRLERVVESRETGLVARAVAGGTPYEVILDVDGAGLISGLLFRVAAPASWAELEKRLREAVPGAGFLTAELTEGGGCRPVRAHARAAERPLGSMFKLYVLGAVAEAVRSGAFGWDTQLTITPELKSLPSGRLQDRPDGSKVSVLEAAKLMISISDNTATDLLIHKVGRKAVERTARAWGAPDRRNVPFLTTRELFVLKGAAYPEHARRYLSLGTAARRAYLEKVVAKVPLSQIRPWTAPRELDTIEWFGSPADICQAYARLAALRDPRVGEALSINDGGLGLDRGRWPAVWFKGGSEPGVLDLSYLARDSAGRTYVVAVMATNAKAPFDEARLAPELLALVRGAFTLAAR